MSQFYCIFKYITFQFTILSQNLFFVFCPLLAFAFCHRGLFVYTRPVHPSVCPCICHSESVLWIFLHIWWRYLTEILYMALSWTVTYQVKVSLCLTHFWLKYAPWWISKLFSTINEDKTAVWGVVLFLIVTVLWST
jgi:hypothetical protein